MYRNVEHLFMHGYGTKLLKNLLILVFSSGRQLSKCISLLAKKGFCYGQFVAFNYRFCQLSLSFFFQLMCMPIDLLDFIFFVYRSQISSLQIIPCFLCTRLILWGLNFWQVFCGNGGEKLLLLAEGLIKKHVASHSLHEPEGFLNSSPSLFSFELK